MQTFNVVRDVDVSGVSGTGVVAEGVVFSNGKCAVSWLTDVTSVSIYDNVKQAEKIHGHGGATRFVFKEN